MGRGGECDADLKAHAREDGLTTPLPTRIPLSNRKRNHSGSAALLKANSHNQAGNRALASDGEEEAERKCKRQRIEKERHEVVEEHSLVSWERLSIDIRASLYYFLVDDGEAKAPEEEEDTIERQ